MQFHFILGWFHLKLCMTKGGGGGLLWPIARRENLISLYSATFVTIYVCNHS